MNDESRVRVWEEDLVIPTYLPHPPDKNPMFLETRVYQGSSGKVYPLPFTDRVDETVTDRAWRAVWLENEYLKVMILPEIGGRIHVLQDKTNGYDVIYRQDVIKPALVGLAGPWISGGIEFNWPQHHRPATFLPVDYEIEEHDNGSLTVWCSDHDPMTRMKGMHGVCLHPGKALVELKVRAYNRTQFVQTFLWWANVACRVHEGYQSFFPPDVTAVADHAKRATSEYPLCQGLYYGVDYAERAKTGVPPSECPSSFVPPACKQAPLPVRGKGSGEGVPSYAANDLSWYANIPVPTSYMCIGSKEGFFGGYDHFEQAGLIHYADPAISPGKKQWTWGNHDFGYAWDRSLSDDSAPYIELMAGVYTDNQPDFSYLQPGETKSWSQFWYPIQKIGPAHHANVDAAVRLDITDGSSSLPFREGPGVGSVHIGVSVLSNYPSATIRLIDGTATTHEWTVDLEPGNPFLADIDARLDSPSIRVVDNAGREIIAYAPRKVEPAAAPPSAVEPPLPKDVASNEELYLIGLHLEQYRHATRSPEPCWEEALRRDPLDARCNNALGRRFLRRGEWKRAEIHFRDAIERLTRLNPNPYDGEPYYNLGLCLRYQLDASVTSPGAMPGAMPAALGRHADTPSQSPSEQTTTLAPSPFQGEGLGEVSSSPLLNEERANPRERRIAISDSVAPDPWTPLSQRGTSEEGEGPGVRANDVDAALSSPSGSSSPLLNEERSNPRDRRMAISDSVAPAPWTPLSQRGTSEEGEGPGVRADDAYAAFAKSAWNQAWAGAAYHAMAELDCRRGDWAAAKNHLESALRLDADNLRVRNLLVIVLRRLGQDDDAEAMLDVTLDLDRLDWWARHLVGEEITCDAQTHLDIAHDLARAGLYDEAIDLLAGTTPRDRSARLLNPVRSERDGEAQTHRGVMDQTSRLPGADLGSGPMIDYTLGWLQEKSGMDASEEYASAAAQAPDYCFPARLEDIAILEAAMRANPADAHAPYYLGNLLYDRGRHRDAIIQWERSAEIEPSYSVVRRNLGIAYYNVLHDTGRARAAYDRAVDASPKDARLLFERDQLWKRTGESPAKRLAVIESNMPLATQRDDLSVELCALYNLTGQSSKAVDLLMSRTFQPWEGGEGQALGEWTRAHLVLGRKALSTDRPDVALKHFQSAMSAPVNLGEARHLLANRSDIHYWTGQALKALGRSNEAVAHWTASATFRGDFQEMSVQRFSEMTYYSALAWKALGREDEAARLLIDLVDYATALQSTQAKIDYFATSLPTMLLFNDDIQARQETTALFLQGQAAAGLGKRDLARELLNTVLQRDPNHFAAITLLEEI